MNTFTKLAQANVNHYNNHPVAHAAIAVAYGVGAVVVVRKAVKRLHNTQDPK